MVVVDGSVSGRLRSYDGSVFGLFRPQNVTDAQSTYNWYTVFAVKARGTVATREDELGWGRVPDPLAALGGVGGFGFSSAFGYSIDRVDAN
jgi:hypothetical protein